MKLSANLDLIWNVVCFFFLLFSCMMCYLQLHNTRLSSIFMCFSFFFFCVANLEKQIIRRLNSLFRNKQCISKNCLWNIYFTYFQKDVYFYFHIKNKTMYFYFLLKRGKVNLTDVHNASVNYDIPSTH